MVQTKHEIQALLDAVGAAPCKRFGQNFLIDGNLIRKLVAEADPQPADTVLEVGPGTGSLTEELLARAGHVVAVEVDRALQGLCASRFAQAAHFTLLPTDVLARKSAIAPVVLETLADRQRALGGRILMVANLPYQVATPLIADILLGDILLSPLCFTVQAEMADRMLAEPNSEAYGPISVLVSVLGRARRIAQLPPEVFWPAPKVHSSMMRIDVETPPGMTAAGKAMLRHLLHACFNHRRKTITWSLQRGLPPTAWDAVIAAGRWDLRARPENLSPADWLSLAEWLTGLSESQPAHDT